MENTTTPPPQNQGQKQNLNKYTGMSLADLKGIDIRKMSKFELKYLVTELDRQVTKVSTSLTNIKKKNIELSKAIVAN